MTDQLRSKPAHNEAYIRNKLDALDREMRGIPSRFPVSRTASNAVVRISETAHGWDLFTVVRWDGAAWILPLADNEDDVDDLFVVAQIVSDDEVLAVGWGLMCVSGLTQYTTYYLSDTNPGELVNTAPTNPASAVRAVLYALPNNVAIVLGPVGAGSAGSGSVTNADLDDIIVAGGPIGSTSTVPVLTWNAKGRLTVVTSATITPGSIGAASAAHTHALSSLSDVTIATPADGHFLRYNGSRWVNYSLGSIGYTPGTGITPEDQNVFYFGTDAGPMLVQISNGSRLIVGGEAFLDFAVRGTISGGTNKYARINVDSNNISFKDDGNETLSWKCSATAGSRRWEFMVPGIAKDNWAVQAASAGSSNLHISGKSYVRYFRGNPTDADIVLDSPTTAHLRAEYDSTYTAFGTGAGGAIILRDSSDLTNRRIAVNENMEVEISYSSTSKIVIDKNSKVIITYPNSNTVTLDSGDFVGSSKAVKLREIDICDAGVAKKMLVLCSAAY